MPTFIYECPAAQFIKITSIMTIAKTQFNRKNILISGGLAVGGPQTHVTILCKFLRAAGLNVTIAATASNMEPFEIEALRKLGVRVLVPKLGFGRFKWIGTLQCLITWPFVLPRRFDTLYCIGHGKMHLFCLRFLHDGGKAIYHEIVQCPKPDSTAAAVAARMNSLVGNSRKVSSELRLLYPSLPVTTIPFLTAEGEMPTPVRKSKTLTGTINVAFFGRMVAHKRPDKLVKEWQKLTKIPGFSPARLDLYGGDYGTGMINQIRDMIKRSGLESEITCHGRYSLKELPGILSRTDLCLLYTSPSPRD